jgi:hypothetical protein
VYSLVGTWHLGGLAAPALVRDAPSRRASLPARSLKGKRIPKPYECGWIIQGGGGAEVSAGMSRMSPYSLLRETKPNRDPRHLTWVVTVAVTFDSVATILRPFSDRHDHQHDQVIRISANAHLDYHPVGVVNAVELGAAAFAQSKKTGEPSSSQDRIFSKLCELWHPLHALSSIALQTRGKTDLPLRNLLAGPRDVETGFQLQISLGKHFCRRVK